LIDALGDKSYSVRRRAADALGDFGAVTPEVVPSSHALTDEQWLVRSAAAKALGKLGPEAKAAVPALERLWLDEQVRVEAANALYYIGPVSDAERVALDLGTAEKKAESAAVLLPTLVTQTGPFRRFGNFRRRVRAGRYKKQWLYTTLRLFNRYRVYRPTRKAAPA
jgi:HEAT repeat protein